MLVATRRKPPYVGVLAVLLAVLSIPLCLRHSGDWDNVYLPAARHLLVGELIFQDGFVYPPINAMLALPAVYLPPMTGIIAWYVLSAAGLLWLVRAAWRLSQTGPDGDPRRDRLVAWLGLLCGLPFAFDCLANRQSDLLVAGLMMSGCLALSSGRSFISAVWFGLAAGLKCTPLLWAPYLALRRRFAAAAVVVAVAVGINTVPDALCPSAQGNRLVQWARLYLAPVATGEREVGVWASAAINNHSLAGVALRWFALERDTVDGRPTARYRTSAVSPRTLRVVTYGADAALLLAVAALMVRRRGRGAEAFDFSLVVLLMLLLSPQSSKPHFCTLALPAFCLARFAFAWRSAVLVAILTAAAIGTLLSNKDLWGTSIYEAAMWYSSVLITTLALFAGCLAARWHCASRTTAQVAGEIRPSQGLDAVA
jgi:hypothetical protein